MTYDLNNDVCISIYNIEGFFDIFIPICKYVLIAFMIFVVLFIYYHFSGVVLDKQQEIGTLRALGISKQDISKIFITENALIALFVIVCSSIITGIVLIIGNQIIMKENYLIISVLNFSIKQIIWIAILECISVFIGIFLPSSKILKKKPVDIICHR